MKISHNGPVDVMSTEAIHIDIPVSLIQIPLSSFAVGATIGVIRGARTTSTRYLAENVHRMPKNREGWYFYYKTKNYRVALGALKGGIRYGAWFGIIGVSWVGIQEGMKLASKRYSMPWLAEGREAGAGIGTMGILSGIYRLSGKSTGKMIAVGMVGGGLVGMLRRSVE